MLAKDFALKEFVYYIPQKLYCVVDDKFHLEDAVNLGGRQTVFPIYILKVVSGEHAGEKLAAFYQNIALVGDLN